MKDYESGLKKVKSEVSKAIKLMGEEHPGAEIGEARRLLEQTATAVKGDDLQEAVALASKAQLAAKPTTEYLLGKAKSTEQNGSRAYKDGELATAIELWQTAIDDYAKAKGMATERNEHEMIEAIESTISSLEGDIERAGKDMASAEMHASVEQANQAVDEGKDRFDSRDYDAAKDKFEAARELYGKAAIIAEERGFEDRDRIRETEAEMGTSIEQCLLAKGEALIAAASEKSGSEKETAFSDIISYLGTFSSTDELYSTLIAKAHTGLANARIEVGTAMMGDAESLFNSGEFYQAKEGYRKAQEHFENLRDYAVEYRLENEKGQADSLIDNCTANIKACTDSMMGREEVAIGNVRRVEDLRKGIAAPAKVERPSDDKLSKLEKEYSWVRYLDSGGFGEVWLAETKDGRTIALKVLREPERHEGTFFKEFELWSKLHHRNIVELLRPRVIPMPLFEMEYIDGGDLKMLLEKHAPFQPERACRIAFDIARGLEYAHASNVIHADLKPRNVLLTKTEEVKITDWGLAKIATSSSKSTNYTPGYAAPEQIRQGPIDKRTDVYQLGLMLYEMATGNNPFDYGSLAEKDEKVLTLTPEKPSRENPRMEPLDDIILCCLEKDPGDRPRVREIREALSKYMYENYGVLLKLTGQTSDRLTVLCRNAMFAAKLKDFAECQRALKDLKAHVSGAQARECINDVMSAMEYRESQGLNITDEVLNDIDSLLRRIEDERS